jgi:hypothetical protein
MMTRCWKEMPHLISTFFLTPAGFLNLNSHTRLTCLSCANAIRASRLSCCTWVRRSRVCREAVASRSYHRYRRLWDLTALAGCCGREPMERLDMAQIPNGMLATLLYRATWRKRSHSNPVGECVELTNLAMERSPCAILVTRVAPSQLSLVPRWPRSSRTRRRVSSMR